MDLIADGLNKCLVFCVMVFWNHEHKNFLKSDRCKVSLVLRHYFTLQFPNTYLQETFWTCLQNT